MEFSKVISEPPGQVCSACANMVNIVSHRERGKTWLYSPFERIDEYPSYPGIRVTAEAGCALCRLICHAITVMSTPSKPSERQRRSAYWRITDPADLQRKFLDVNWDRKVKVTVKFGVGEFRHRYVTELHNSAETDSQGGLMIDTMFVHFSPAAAKINDWEAFKWGNSELQFYVYESLGGYSLSTLARGRMLTALLLPFSDMRNERIQRRRILPSLSTLSEANIAKIQGWVDACRGSHSMCSINADYWAPTRLLKIAPAENTFRCQVIETEDDNGLGRRDSQYAALSHMWGDISISPPLRLFQSNYERLKKGINPTDLPKNFFEAVQVCLKLDIRYLWIDSLCIIQDSDADWRHEASQMHLVYQYAAVTIAATQATSSHDGFLERDVGRAPSCKIPYRSLAGDTEYMILRWQEWPMADHRLSAVNGAEWNTRGWTMQERSLSTRTLHFCKNKIFFECRGALESEENEPPDEEEFGTIPMWPQSGTIPLDRLHGRWRIFVAQYSERNLTKSSDKLVAIQSIATRMASMTRGDYMAFAGMWSENIGRELLWSVTFSSAKRCEPWIAPTWSWASVDGTVALPEWTISKSRSVPTSLNQMLLRYPFEVISHGGAGTDSVSSPCGYLKVRTLSIQVSRIQCRGKAERGWGTYDIYFGAQDSDDSIFAHARLDVGTDSGPCNGSTESLLYMHVNICQQPTGLLLREYKPTTSTENDKRWVRIGVATLFNFHTGKLLAGNPFRALDFTHTFIIV
ncbi:heterokaryon incompatibility protein-domain-containing protein [Xylaria arbuscula]|nr:heterokaryon incompatibility protein-domain-containing protein [Xylaria arbuscula]